MSNPMPLSSVNWVNGIAPHRLALMPRPAGGDDLHDELTAWRQAGIDTVVSLLERREVVDLELRTEAALCAEQGIRFLEFPIADRGLPAAARPFATLLEQLHAELMDGRAVAIHCRAGIGRTGLVAGCLLHRLGLVPLDDIFPVLSRSRGVPVPDTPEQVEWVRRFVQSAPPPAPP